MNLTAEQEKAIQNGAVVPVTIGGAACVVLRKDIYERGEGLDYSPWTVEEMDMLAAETADRLAGDGFDEPDPACLFIQAATPEAKAAGVDRDCLISCTLLSLMSEERLTQKIGKLPAPLLAQLDDCLKAALGIA